ncbi:cupin domain-containing protein [Chromobacterium phragmitis]|uniref:Cupin n=2 Tax=Chromobacterium phragmitis TaxID=2202141 RepID=A0A344UH89_9NEIS|nr:cupin [Chromobacterium phragmitis]AXE34637.1 cupin [Chromobacterium phragmitis]
MLKTLAAIMAACLSGGALGGSSGGASWPADTLPWRGLPGGEGIQVADVAGSLTAGGPYQAFVHFPAGWNNPPHTHGSDLPTVVLAGVFYAEAGGKRTLYPAGSYYLLPAEWPHASGCLPGADCLLFQFQRDRFDLKPLR